MSLKPPLIYSLSSACSKRRGRSRAICHWAAWEKKPCCVSSLTARISRLSTSALDSDQAGNDACSRLAELVPEGLTVHRLVPLYKDWNEVLQHRAEITDGKYIREAVYGLKEPPQEETVEIIRMSEVDTQTVEWLWEPYIPFGKVTIVQGNPGEGKTTFALRLAAACTTGGTLPGMKPLPPFQVIYQTAEDGLGRYRQAPLDRSRSRP